MAIQASSSCGGYSLSVQGCVAMVAALALPGAAPIPTSKTPAADAAVKIKSRRLTVGARRVVFIATSSGLLRVCGAMNGAAQGLVCAAAANVGDIRVDFGVRRFGKSFQERRHGHDLPRLAVAALRHAVLNPRALHRMTVG